VAGDASRPERPRQSRRRDRAKEDAMTDLRDLRHEMPVSLGLILVIVLALVV